MSIFYEIFIYSRPLIEEGQVWRLISAHFIHLSVLHALFNLMGLVLLILLNKRFILSSRCLLVVLLLCLWVSAGLWLFNPEVARYVGFSGVLHGLFVYGILSHPQSSPVWKVTLICATISKVAAEQTGIYDTTSLAVDIGGRVMVDAHFYGLTGGLLLFIFTTMTAVCRRHPLIHR